METAPFFADIADGPQGAQAWWLKTEDGVRIRVGLWQSEGKSQRGTVLMFPGRTEYIEKYGRDASELTARGFAVLAIDWRGQGLADRMADDPSTGHVQWFSDYQLDVQAAVTAARTLGLPEPYYLLAHSMGGCIGLRALHNDLPVAAAAFSAPMWGIKMAPATRPAAWALAWGGMLLGMGDSYAPGTKADSYVISADFKDNMLTTDRDMWDYMVDQATAHPELTLGGPSLRWLYEALREMLDLHRAESPGYPTVTFLGSNERIVDPSRIHSRMARWHHGALELIQGGEHEVLMETPTIRARVFDQLGAHFGGENGHESPGNARSA